MAKRRKLEAPDPNALAEMEAGFAAKPMPDRMGQGIGGHRVGKLGGGRDQALKSLPTTGRSDCALESRSITARFQQGGTQIREGA